MFKAIKEFFLGKTPEPVVVENPPYKVEAPTVQVPEAVPAQPVVENKVDAVSVALDLEPVDLAATPAEPAKKPRKPRAPKATAEQAPKEKKAAKPKAEKAPKKPAAIKAKKAK